MQPEVRPSNGFTGVTPKSTRQIEDSDLSFSVEAALSRVLRRWPLIVTFLVLGLLGGIFIAILPRHYTAVSQIQVRPGSSSQYRLDKSDLLNVNGDSDKLETETMILQSNTLLLATAKELNLDHDPNMVGALSHDGDEDAPKAEEKLLAKLHQNVHATLIPRSEMIQVSCTSKSAILSARVVNTLVAEYIQRLFESRFSSTKHVSSWLSGQLDDLKKKVEADQEKLIQLQSRLGIVGLNDNHDIVVSELEDLTKAADEARVQRIIAEARYRILQNGDVNLLEGGQDILGRDSPNASQLSLLANLRNQKAQVEARYAGLSAQFGPKYPEVLQANAQLTTLNHEIQQEQARVLHQAEQAYDAANRSEQNTEATLGEKKTLAFQKQNDMVQYQILLHEYESSRTLYEGLLQRLQQAGIVAGLESSEVDIVDMARIPGKPSETSRAVTIALGAIFGLVSGLIIAALIANFDQRLQNLTQVESEMGLPLLSITAAANEYGTSRYHAIPSRVSDLFVNEPSSPFVESMWSLRASLLLSNPDHPPKTMLFTSCNLGEGKSTIASGQACALSMRDAKVLLIDADMRRPTIMSRFGLKNQVGLSSILTGRARLEDAIQSVPSLPNLSILTSGPIPPSAALILASESMAELIATARRLYDFVLIDSPPSLGLVDSTSLAQFCEVIILVVSYVKLNKAQINRVRNVLGRVGASITGIALNFASTDSLVAYGYGYDYYTDAGTAKDSSKGTS